ncbi:D-2-hydroxyacid dehydrogenase [Allorhodopirellula heiligendammensis]|uniref:Glycerate dehydrogenase n=1 Tax=Allorhodopirellula heiligendammensis TaxID=2714739 RepID=A0A5C6C0X3_9BACT|nr:D-2-hydroxyacid dehydrogenase [Allorhodopirellula heiligendammensis]TWU16499.1 Glycerate dehydrogenase [Allorhodopirellula heiligendammensis]
MIKPQPFESIRRIVLCYPVEAHHRHQIERTLAELTDDASIPLHHSIEVVDAGQERIDELLPTADIFIGHAKVPVDWDRALAANRLRWIQSSAAGLDHCLVPGVIAHPQIVVSSASGLFAPQVAEQTFALMMGLLRRIGLFERARQIPEFIRRPTDDLRGKTVGIVGLGGNGREIAKMLRPWEVRVLATDFYPESQPPEVAELWPAARVNDLFAAADIVILTLPLNALTHHCIGAEQFAAMKPGGYFINVARGPVVDEAALVAALASGHLAGAGVDVTETEPLPPTSPLWTDPHVLITPHVGAQSIRRVDDTTDLVCINLRRYFAGDPLFNRVDKNLGFPHPSVSYRVAGAAAQVSPNSAATVSNPSLQNDTRDQS